MSCHGDSGQQTPQKLYSPNPSAPSSSPMERYQCIRISKILQAKPFDDFDRLCVEKSISLPCTTFQQMAQFVKSLKTAFVMGDVTGQRTLLIVISLSGHNLTSLDSFECSSIRKKSFCRSSPKIFSRCKTAIGTSA